MEDGAGRCDIVDAGFVLLDNPFDGTSDFCKRTDGVQGMNNARKLGDLGEKVAGRGNDGYGHPQPHDRHIGKIGENGIGCHFCLGIITPTVRKSALSPPGIDWLVGAFVPVAIWRRAAEDATGRNVNEFYAETMTSGCKFYWEDGIGFCGEEHILWRLLTEIDIVQAIFCWARC